MPTNTYDLISSTTLSSTASTIALTSIPSTYRDLVLVIDVVGTSTTVNTLYARLNSDSGNNYFSVLMAGTNSNTAVGATSATGGSTELNISDRSNAGFSDTRRALYILNFVDSSATDKHKTILQRANSQPSGEVVAQAQRWANTSAISRIDLFPYAGSFNTSSVFSLYGIVS